MPGTIILNIDGKDVKVRWNDPNPPTDADVAEIEAAWRQRNGGGKHRASMPDQQIDVSGGSAALRQPKPEENVAPFRVTPESIQPSGPDPVAGANRLVAGMKSLPFMGKQEPKSAGLPVYKPPTNASPPKKSKAQQPQPRQQSTFPGLPKQKTAKDLVTAPPPRDLKKQFPKDTPEQERNRRAWEVAKDIAVQKGLPIPKRPKNKAELDAVLKLIGEGQQMQPVTAETLAQRERTPNSFQTVDPMAGKTIDEDQAAMTQKIMRAFKMDEGSLVGQMIAGYIPSIMAEVAVLGDEKKSIGQKAGAVANIGLNTVVGPEIVAGKALSRVASVLHGMGKAEAAAVMEGLSKPLQTFLRSQKVDDNAARAFGKRLLSQADKETMLTGKPKPASVLDEVLGPQPAKFTPAEATGYDAGTTPDLVGMAKQRSVLDEVLGEPAKPPTSPVETPQTATATVEPPAQTVTPNAWVKAKEYKGSDGGKYADYALFGDLKRGTVTVEIDRKNGYRVRNVFVDAKDMRSGHATNAYRALNDESIAATGKPLRSSTVGRNDRTTLNDDGVALWESLVAKGEAANKGDHYAFVEKSDASMTPTQQPDVSPKQAIADITVTPTAAVAESATTPTAPTSARQADINADREALGKAGFSTDDVRKWSELEAKANPNAVPKDDNGYKTGAWTDQETVNATAKLRELKSQIEALRKSGDDPETLVTLEDEFDQLTEAMYRSGTEQGRALAARRYTLDLDMDPDAMRARYKARAAKYGSKVDPKRLAELEAMAEEFAKAKARVAELEAQKPIDIDMVTAADPRLDPMHYDPMTDGTMYDPDFVNRVYVELFGDLPGDMPLEARAKAVREMLQQRAERAIEQEVRESNVATLKYAAEWWGGKGNKGTGPRPKSEWNIAVPGRYPGEFVAGQPVRMVSTEEVPEDLLGMFLDWLPSRTKGAEKYISGAGKNDFGDSKLFGADVRSAEDRAKSGRVFEFDELMERDGNHGLIPQSVVDEYVRDLKALIGEDTGVAPVRRQRRQQIDAEFDELVSEFKRVALSSANTGIPPELVPIVGKMVSNRIRRGAMTIDDIILAIQAKFKERLAEPPDRQAIIDAYAEYKATNKKELPEKAKRLREQKAKIERELREASTQRQDRYIQAAEAKAKKAADAAEARAKKAAERQQQLEADRKVRADQKAKARAEREAADAEAKALREEQERILSERAAWDKRNKERQRELDRLNTRIAELEQSIEAGTGMAPKAKPPKTIADPEALKLQNRMKALQERARAIYREQQPKTTGQRISDLVTEGKLINPVARAFDLLSGVGTIINRALVDGNVAALTSALSKDARVGFALEPAKIRRVVDVMRASEMGKRWVSEGMYGTKGIGGKMAALTDVPARLFLYHMTLDDMAFNVARRELGKAPKEQITRRALELLQNPTDEMIETSTAEMLAGTYNSRSALSKALNAAKKVAETGIRGGENTGARAVGADMFTLVFDSLTRFSNVIGNVVKDRALRTINIGGIPVSSVAAVGQAGYKTAKKIPMSSAERRGLQMLFAKGMTGTALMYMGYHFAEDMGIKPQVVRNTDEEGKDPGAPFVEPKGFVSEAFEQTGGIFAPFFYGATLREIERSDLTDNQKRDLKQRVLMDLTTSMPATGGMEKVTKLMSGQSGFGETLGGLAANQVPAAVKIGAERLDAYMTTGNAFGEAPKRRAKTTKEDSFWEALTTPIKRNIPGLRGTLPTQNRKTVN